MNALENATQFFHNCESGKGWDACKSFVDGNGVFTAQSEPLAEVNQIKDYVDWMAGLCQVTMPGSGYTIHSASLDEANSTALFFATFTGTHSGDGGPVPPTNKTTNSHYVYAMKMTDAGLIESMTKIWNASWALREVGWM